MRFSSQFFIEFHDPLVIRASIFSLLYTHKTTGVSSILTGEIQSLQF
jgi:hypothetical protein